MIKKKIYIGGGFSYDQLLWVIPILDKYNNNRINQLIFQNFSKKILKNKSINDILKKYEILNHDLAFPFFLKYKYLRYIYVLFVYFPLIFILSFYVSRFNILNKKISWFKSQIMHAVWDTSLLMCKDNETEPNYLVKFFASFKCIYSYFLAKKLTDFGVSEVFLGHSVYNYRCMLAYFRERKIPVISQASFNLHKQKIKTDFHWSEISKKNFLKFKKKISFEIVNKYFRRRNIGKGNYLDSVNATKKKINNLNEKYNIIFLHVFKDSPFNCIDRGRIFADYYHWIEETLLHVKSSNEKWLLRLHPSHKKWGENQLQILNSIIRNIYKSKLPNNIFIEKNKFSNIELFKNAQKIITFNGTVELEAACFGLKPIVISSQLLQKIDKSMVFKPKTRKEYFDLINTPITNNKTSSFFKLDKNSIEKAKLLLFIRENVFYIKKILCATEMYRKDSDFKKNKNFNMISKNILINKNYLFKLGEYLRSKRSIQVVNPKYLNFIDG
jgi:hypothetical protein